MTGPGSATEQVVGRYAVSGELASGGMATIFVGHPIGSTRPVAIKKLHKPYAGNVEFLTMFLDEMWVAARVRHVNIVETLDVSDGGLPAPHLRDHLVSGEPIKVTYTINEEGQNVALRYVDAL